MKITLFKICFFLALALPMLAGTAAANEHGDSVVERTANNGNVELQDVPEVPEEIIDELRRYSNIRSASLADFAADEGIYITTRFGETSQIHHVEEPMAARRQITFFDEPVAGVQRRPEHAQLAFLMDEGGSENDQIYLLNPATGRETMVSDGKSRNGFLQFSRDGSRLAYQSTRRNGRSNDIWIMHPDQPDAAEVVLESPDGSYWLPADFSADNNRLLVLQYISVADSRIHVVDFPDKQRTLVAGNADDPTRNYPVAFDARGEGFYFLTDVGSQFTRLAWQSLVDSEANPVFITNDINWDVESVVHDKARSQMAFTVNRDGLTDLYLLDTSDNSYRQIDALPQGIVSGLEFAPDGNTLGLTFAPSGAPADVYSIDLGGVDASARQAEATRWTRSEVGGLDTERFVTPKLVKFPTFDQVDGKPRQIPAFVFQPRGDGPHPVVVYIHGGPEGQYRPSFSGTFQMWIDKLGVAVIAPNVRGSAGYGKDYLALDNGYLREDSVKDIGALLDWIATQPQLDENRVAVYGGSYGGYMVLASAVHYSKRLQAAVDIVGISNFVTFLTNTKDYRRDLRRAEYGDERDDEMRAHLEKISPSTNVDQIKVPLLVIQGENDPRVPVTEAEQIVQAVRENDKEVWYLNALNEGHGFRKKENRDLMNQVVVMFLREHLLGGEEKR